MDPEFERGFSIVDASLKDDFCTYKYEVTTEPGRGDRHTVNGSGIVKDELKEAFKKLNVHLAHIDDAFKHRKKVPTSIMELMEDEQAGLYEVTGFTLKGGSTNGAVILAGSKYVSVGGRISINTPKVMLDNLSGYPFYEELKEAIEECREQVALYKEGNYIATSDDDELPGQGKMEFPSVNEEDFSGAEI